jgi:hypothetical protein
VISVFQIARELKTSRYSFERLTYDDDLGTYVVQSHWRGAWGVITGKPWEYDKVYLTGSRLFNRELSEHEYNKYVEEAEKKYGYLDWKGDYVPGEVPLREKIE